MKTVEAIIERLEENKGSNGCAGLLKSWVDNLTAYKDDFVNGKIIGFLWGINALSFISDDEHNAALQEFMNLCYPPSGEEARA